MNLETTYGMIKPEGLEKNLVEEIKRRITEAGLRIEKEKQTTLSGKVFDLIYGHVKEKLPLIYSLLKDYLTTQQVIIFEVSGENAVQTLLRVRGSSNPKEALPGSIRGDYAGDQDYNKLYKQGKFALNIFHAADSEDEAKEVLGNFFSNEK